MFDALGFMMIMMWPAVPMFLIELHFAINFWRRLGIWTYGIILLEWLPVAFVLTLFQEPITRYQIGFEPAFLVLGAILIALGLALHTWTAKLIGLKATIGYAELKPGKSSKEQTLVMSGPFSVVRHPSYWAHGAIIAGFFLITGIIALGVIALIDLTINYFVTTNLEDHELVERFGAQYKEYQRRVPKFFPKVIPKRIAV